MKAELKKLCKSPMESLIVLFMFLVVNQIVLFMFLVVNQIVRTMKAIIFMLLNLLGLLMINLVLGVLSSRFKKNPQDNIKFTFDVSKCDRIFDELNRLGCIKLSHTISPIEELKRHAYCKWHNSFSHATNDCNVFRRQIQSAVNEG